MRNKKTYQEDHVLTMFEDIKSQNKIVIEQYSGLTEKVDIITEKIDLITEDIDEIKSTIMDMKDDITQTKRDVSDIKKELKIKADKDVFYGHEKRIIKLENVVLAKA